MSTCDNLKEWRNASSRKVSEQVVEGWDFDRKLLKRWAPSPTICKEETDNWLVFMQSAESAHGGLQKVTAFKKVHGSIVKILVCVSFVWYIWLQAKNCLKWGKIYIALEMLFAGGGGGLGYRMPLNKRLSSWCFKFLFFFPGISLFRSCFFTHKLWK